MKRDKEESDDREEKRSNACGKRKRQCPYEDRIFALKKYIEEYGDSKVPKTFTCDGKGERNLGHWVSRMRDDKEKGRMPEERRIQLEEYGFVWRLRSGPGKLMPYVNDAVRRARLGDERCIVWPFGKFSNGYGAIYFEGRLQHAHRVALILYSGKDFGKSRESAHGPCHNRLCINPLHVYWATHSENMRDRHRDGTASIGEKNGNGKLAEEDVIEIRRKYSRGEGTQISLAKEFHVHQGTIHQITSYKTWKHIQ
jgi:hypothetical protein